jgi:hypothetical protein
LNYPNLIVLASAAAAVAVEKKTVIIVEDYNEIFDIDSHSTRSATKKKKKNK